MAWCQPRDYRGRRVAPARACREATGTFLRGEPRSDASGLELFRRAVCERDQDAWNAVVAEYRGLILAWVRRHPAAACVHEPDDY